MRAQLTITDIRADEIADVVEAFGIAEPVEIGSPHPGRFAVTVRWKEDPAHLMPGLAHLDSLRKRAPESPGRDAEILDRLAYLLAAPEWPGASGMEDVAELVALVRDVTTKEDHEWPRH